MKSTFPFFIILSVCLSAAGCDALEYHPYSEKIEGATGTNGRNIDEISRICQGGTFKFAFITDTQGAYDETEEALEIIRERRDIDFIIHGGDQTDFGLPKEFKWCRNLLEKSGLPYVAVIGNHDCVGNGKDTFEYIYGITNFSFNAGKTHFLCMNTVALEYDYSHPVPDFDFMESDYKNVCELNAAFPDSITHTVCVMHSRPYDEQFNNNVAKPFNYYVQQYPGMGEDAPVCEAGNDFKAGTKAMSFCLNGHNHSYAITDIFDNGILYYQAPNIAKRVFMVFTIKNDGYECETVEF